MLSIKYHDSHLKLKDGTRLISRIWLPEGHGKWPALLMRQPYGREIASTITYAHPTWWASKGYMVIIQDVRGQGGSEGQFKGFHQEADDTSETHEWVRSLKECNGKLGLFGFSYQGLTQLTGTDKTEPPDCLSPAMTGLDIREHWCSDGGAFWWNNNISWGLQIAALKMRREKDMNGWKRIRSMIENQTHLQDGLKLLKELDPDNFILQWLDILDHGKNFEEIRTVDSWLKKPMLILGGLWDPHLRGALDLYKKSKDLGGDPEIIISNSSHLNWWKDSQITLLTFFDKHLKSIDQNKILNPKQKKIWNISTKKWECIENVPLNYEFCLESDGNANFETIDGSLSINAKSSGFVSIVHDPWRPIPSDGGHLGKNPGLFNRCKIDKRLDVAVFQTHHIKENIHLSGIPTFSTAIICDQESFDICLSLSIIDKDEEIVTQFTTGFLRVRNSIKDIEQNYIVKFHPTNISILKGNKLRLSISASAWPAIGVNSGCKEKFCGNTSIDHRITTINFNLKKSIMKIAPFFK
tara:strand:+ start:1249 stop:2820 length:1572 start_codon:yes stop_codon:yes gene_type:complete